jgi:hypothetical protein
MDDLDQFAESLDILVIIETISLPPTYAARVINRRGFHDQQADASSGDSLIKCQHFGTHMQIILVPHEHAGDGLDDSVPGFDRPDAAGFEKLFIS